MIVTKNEIKSMIYGLAVGDAMGVPVEFTSRAKLEKEPVKEMLGNGSYPDIPHGVWSDDTSMTLCLMESMARTGKLDFADIMNNFVQWEEGDAFNATGVTFDIGRTCNAAIQRFVKGADPLACGGKTEGDNGNGALMRISPMALWLAVHPGADMDESMEMVHQVASLTHAHPRSKMACGIYVLILLYVIQGRALKDAVRTGLNHGIDFYSKKPAYKKEVQKYTRMCMDSFASLPASKIKSGGYVVDTLEAAVWCIVNTDNYRDCILKAVNLGEDTDTVAAVAGAVAGLAYGYDSIPKGWIDNSKYKNRSLKGKEWLDNICEKFSVAIVAKE